MNAYRTTGIKCVGWLWVGYEAADGDRIVRCCVGVLSPRHRDGIVVTAAAGVVPEIVVDCKTYKRVGIMFSSDGNDDPQHRVAVSGPLENFDGTYIGLFAYLRLELPTEQSRLKFNKGHPLAKEIWFSEGRSKAYLLECVGSNCWLESSVRKVTNAMGDDTIKFVRNTSEDDANDVPLGTLVVFYNHVGLVVDSVDGGGSLVVKTLF